MRDSDVDSLFAQSTSYKLVHVKAFEYRMDPSRFDFYEPLAEDISGDVCFDTQLPAGVGSFAQLIGRVI